MNLLYCCVAGPPSNMCLYVQFYFFSIFPFFRISTILLIHVIGNLSRAHTADNIVPSTASNSNVNWNIFVFHFVIFCLFTVRLHVGWSVIFIKHMQMKYYFVFSFGSFNLFFFFRYHKNDYVNTHRLPKRAFLFDLRTLAWVDFSFCHFYTQFAVDICTKWNERILTNWNKIDGLSKMQKEKSWEYDKENERKGKRKINESSFFISLFVCFPSVVQTISFDNFFLFMHCMFHDHWFCLFSSQNLNLSPVEWLLKVDFNWFILNLYPVLRELVKKWDRSDTCMWWISCKFAVYSSISNNLVIVPVSSSSELFVHNRNMQCIYFVYGLWSDPVPLFFFFFLYFEVGFCFEWLFFFILFRIATAAPRNTIIGKWPIACRLNRIVHIPHMEFSNEKLIQWSKWRENWWKKEEEKERKGEKRAKAKRENRKVD